MVRISMIQYILYSLFCQLCAPKNDIINYWIFPLHNSQLIQTFFQAFVSWKHEDDKVIVFERAELVFVFNFHTEKSFADYPIGVNIPGTYKVVLNSDDNKFGGCNRIDTNVSHFTKPDPFADRNHRMFVYSPCRTAAIYAKH